MGGERQRQAEMEDKEIEGKACCCVREVSHSPAWGRLRRGLGPLQTLGLAGV